MRVTAASPASRTSATDPLIGAVDANAEDKLSGRSRPPREEKGGVKMTVPSTSSLRGPVWSLRFDLGPAPGLRAGRREQLIPGLRRHVLLSGAVCWSGLVLRLLSPSSPTGPRLLTSDTSSTCNTAWPGGRPPARVSVRAQVPSCWFGNLETVAACSARGRCRWAVAIYALLVAPLCGRPRAFPPCLRVPSPPLLLLSSVDRRTSFPTLVRGP